MPRKPIALPPPIEIRIPADTPAVGVIAILLATIGRPPVSAQDQGWRQTVSAFRREKLENVARATLALGAPPAEPLLITAEDLLVTDEIRADRLEHARLGINRALFAAAVAAPDVTRRLLEEMGEPLGTLPRNVRAPEARGLRIERILQEEDELAAVRERVGIPPAPRRISSAGPASQAAVRNIQTRILQPAEPVLHLALGLKFSLDAMEKRLVEIFPTREEWERAGFGTTPKTEENGEIRMVPMIMERNILALAGAFLGAIEAADLYLPHVEDYLREGRRTQLRPLVNLILE
jgi:hypothetical protein